jgi:hypothetical protein
MDVMFTVKAETPQEWKSFRESVWFYLEDVPINKRDFTIQHCDTGFTIKLHEWDALRARDALKGFCELKPINIVTKPLMDNPEIAPVKKRKRKKEQKNKVQNVKIQVRDNVALRDKNGP